MIKIIFLLLILGGYLERESALSLKKSKPKVGTITQVGASIKKLKPKVGTITQVGASTETTQGSEKEEGIKWHSFEEGIKRAKEDQRAIILYFTAPWCRWCKKLEKETFTNRELCEKLKDIICIKVDVSEDKNPAIMYQIRGIPTILFLDANTEVKRAIMGFRSPKALLNEIKFLFDGKS